MRRLVVAGGETSGAVVQALGVRRCAIGPQIDPGVPWTTSTGDAATRAGAQVRQFRRIDFFLKSLAMLAAMSDARHREALCALGRSLFERGLTHGSTGNLSVRAGDGFLMTPTGLLARHARSGATVASSTRAARTSPATRRPRRRCCTSRCTASAPRDGAVVHLHSTHSVAVSVLADVDPDDALPPLTAYYVMRVGKLPMLPYFPPGRSSLGAAVGGWPGRHHAVLLANHGPVVSGATLGAAAEMRSRSSRPPRSSG